MKLPSLVLDNVHCFHWLCFISYYCSLVPRLTAFKKFHERRPHHWPNFNQSEYRWRTGGSKSSSCPYNNVRNLYYSRTHFSDYSLLLQELCKSDSSRNCLCVIFGCCVGDNEGDSWHKHLLLNLSLLWDPFLGCCSVVCILWLCCFECQEVLGRHVPSSFILFLLLHAVLYIAAAVQSWQIFYQHNHSCIRIYISYRALFLHFYWNLFTEVYLVQQLN